MKLYTYILLFIIILLFSSCSINFYPKNYKLKKNGYMYYEINIDSLNNLTEIKKYKKRFFCKERKIVKYISIDKNNNIRILKFKNGQMNGWEIKYDNTGNKSKGNKFKKGKIVVLETPNFWLK